MEAVLARNAGVCQNLLSNFDEASQHQQMKDELAEEKRLHEELKGTASKQIHFHRLSNYVSF